MCTTRGHLHRLERGASGAIAYLTEPCHMKKKQKEKQTDIRHNQTDKPESKGPLASSRGPIIFYHDTTLYKSPQWQWNLNNLSDGKFDGLHCELSKKVFLVELWRHLLLKTTIFEHFRLASSSKYIYKESRGLMWSTHPIKPILGICISEIFWKCKFSPWHSPHFFHNLQYWSPVGNRRGLRIRSVRPCVPIISETAPIIFPIWSWGLQLVFINNCL